MTWSKKRLISNLIRMAGMRQPIADPGITIKHGKNKAAINTITGVCGTN